ncbi:MAG TPA: sulfotransferase [Rhizomicrobium sp.]|nr:sulfotransferase [Rhizomicrobium sp.]
MSQLQMRRPASSADLYARLALALERAVAEPADAVRASGFVDPAPQDDPGIFRPPGELPEHLFDAGAVEGGAKFCLFGGRAYVGIRGGALTEFERHKRANTVQPLAIVFNGTHAVEIAYPFDGRAGWTCFPVELPAALGRVTAVEIERDGKLLFSRNVAEDPGRPDYRAGLWLINAAGRLSGAVNGASCDVAVEIRLGGRSHWAISNPPPEAGRPRPFEFDLAPFCSDGLLQKVSVVNPATGAEAARSPVGVFASRGAHFLFAHPEIADGTCRAVLLHWKDGRRRRLSLHYAEDLTLDEVARVDLDDPAEARFEGGDNSFVLDLEILRSGEVMILDEEGAMLGKLPPLRRIMALAGLSEFAHEPTAEAMVAWAREAVTAERWPEAAERWTACIAKFGDKQHWLANRARALAEAMRFAEAEREYVLLAERFPHRSDGLAGLARLAQARGDWAGAAALWTACLEKFPGEHAAQRMAAKASALRHIGRFAEAERLLRAVAERHPGDAALIKARIKAAIDHAHHTGQSALRRDEICDEIEAHFPADAGNGAFIEGMRLLSRLGEYERARRRLVKAVPQAADPEEIEILFRGVGELVEAGSRGVLWEQLLERARPLSAELELRLLLAQERFAQFRRRFDETRGALADSRNFVQLERVRARLDKPRAEVFAEPKIFGIGLSRTGTRSLTEALRILDIDAVHWVNPLTYQLIGAGDVYLFGACTDISVAQDFEKLYCQYPNARFVWTQRSVEDWTASITRHYEFWHRASGVEGLRRELDREAVPFGLSRVAIEFGLYLNNEDFAAAHRSFEQRLRNFFRDKPAGKLLELDIFAGQGWSELCAFLGRAVPDRPFPHANKGLK